METRALEPPTPSRLAQPVEPGRPIVRRDNGTRPWIDPLTREHGFEPLRIEGTLPPELNGTLYRTGPAHFESFGEPYGHWFDGDGAISAVRIDEGRAFGAVRFVQTEGLRHERRAGRRIYGGYGTASRRSWRAPFGGRAKNTANTSCLAWGGRLLSLWEAGHPYEIDPQTLRTIGETDLGGAIPGAFSAHPHYVAALDTTFNFGVSYGRKTHLDLFALRRGGRADRLARFSIPPFMVHDFAATDRHLIFFCSPLRLDLRVAALNLGYYEQNLRWRPDEGTEILIFPLRDLDRPIRLKADPFFQWHFVNAFEEGDEIVADFIHYDSFRATSEWLRSFLHRRPRVPMPGQPRRARINLRRGSVSVDPFTDVVGEFPKVAPRAFGAAYRYFWMGAHSTPNRETDGLWDRIAKVDARSGAVELTDLGPGQHPSEPIFVPRPGAQAEDDGWIVSACYDTRSQHSFVAVLDARHPSAAPLARLWFDHHIPMAFHGDFDQRR
ncbi:MAG: carotenoid oxygenase family protein [Myxococcota bacterium]